VIYSLGKYYVKTIKLLDPSLIPDRAKKSGQIEECERISQPISNKYVLNYQSTAKTSNSPLTYEKTIRIPSPFHFIGIMLLKPQNTPNVLIAHTTCCV